MPKTFLDTVDEAKFLWDEIVYKTNQLEAAYKEGKTELTKTIARSAAESAGKFIPLYEMVTNPYAYLKYSMEMILAGKPEEFDMKYAKALIKKLQMENDVKVDEARAEMHRYFPPIM